MTSIFSGLPNDLIITIVKTRFREDYAKERAKKIYGDMEPRFTYNDGGCQRKLSRKHDVIFQKFIRKSGAHTYPDEWVNPKQTDGRCLSHTERGHRKKHRNYLTNVDTKAHALNLSMLKQLLKTVPPVEHPSDIGLDLVTSSVKWEWGCLWNRVACYKIISGKLHWRFQMTVRRMPGGGLRRNGKIGGAASTYVTRCFGEQRRPSVAKWKRM